MAVSCWGWGWSVACDLLSGLHALRRGARRGRSGGGDPQVRTLFIGRGEGGWGGMPPACVVCRSTARGAKSSFCPSFFRFTAIMMVGQGGGGGFIYYTECTVWRSPVVLIIIIITMIKSEYILIILRLTLVTIVMHNVDSHCAFHNFPIQAALMGFRQAVSPLTFIRRVFH